MTYAPKAKRTRSDILRDLSKQGVAFAKEVLLVGAAVLLINSFVMASFEVPSSSMERTVMTGDRVLVNKFIYGGTTPYTIPFTSIRLPHLRVPGFRSVQRGDVIVFDWPGPRDQMEKPKQVFYLKRCIGLPGDTVRIDHKAVYVNDESFPLPEHSQFLQQEQLPAGWADSDIFPRGAAFNMDNWGPMVVPRRGSRIPLDEANLQKWAVFITREGHRVESSAGTVLIDGAPAKEYTVERDYVFALGDNRDNSLDSRYWGFIPMEDIIGTPMVVYWSWDQLLVKLIAQVCDYREADELIS